MYITHDMYMGIRKTVGKREGKRKQAPHMEKKPPTPYGKKRPTALKRKKTPT